MGGTVACLLSHLLWSLMEPAGKYQRLSWVHSSPCLCWHFWQGKVKSYPSCNNLWALPVHFSSFDWNESLTQQEWIECQHLPLGLLGWGTCRRGMLWEMAPVRSSPRSISAHQGPHSSHLPFLPLKTWLSCHLAPSKHSTELLWGAAAPKAAAGWALPCCWRGRCTHCCAGLHQGKGSWGTDTPVSSWWAMQGVVLDHCWTHALWSLCSLWEQSKQKILSRPYIWQFAFKERRGN